MKAEIRDESLLRTLEPTSLAGYLKSRNWSLAGRVKADVPVFVKGDQEVFLPLSTRYSDYGLRIGELLRALARDESRSQLEIFEDLLFTSADKIRFRLKSPLAKRGALPINLGVTFFEKARDVILAAACAAVEIKPYFHGRRVQKVDDYMRRVYLGQTQRGSFVLNAGSPVSRPVDQLVEEEPFERVVTEMLLQGVNAARSAAEEVALGTDVDPFYGAHKRGVSANLCGALADLFLGEESARLEVALQWSPLRPAPAVASSSVWLESRIGPILQEASRSLKRRAPREGFEVVGSIVSLHREENQDQGRAVIYALVDEGYRRVAAVLESDDYNLAVEAHGARQPVTLEGELIRKGKSYVLKHPRNFRVVEIVSESEDFSLDFGD